MVWQVCCRQPQTYLELTLSIEAFDLRRTEIRLSLEEIIISIVSEIGKYSCDQAKLYTGSYIRALISKNVIPFGKANTIYSVYELVDRALTIDEIKYKRCDSKYCPDWEWDGKSLRTALRT